MVGGRRKGRYEMRDVTHCTSSGHRKGVWCLDWSSHTIKLDALESLNVLSINIKQIGSCSILSF